MKWMLAIAASVALLSAPAFGASKLEASRASAVSARKQLSDVKAQQLSLRGELDRISERISALKAKRKGRQAGEELESALRRSQELSTSLTAIAKSLSAAESSVERENLALLQALSEELTRLRAEFDRGTDRQARRRIIDRMRALRAEREQLRSLLPPTQVPALESPSVSEDPEDLLEQLDALRDTEDKVRRELSALERRITEKREERELDRRMNEFLGEESIFDEQDRRLRLRRDSVERERTTEAPQSNTLGFGGTDTREGAAAPMGAGEPTAAPPSESFTGTVGAGDVNQNQKTSTAPSVTESFIGKSARASDARPTVEGGRARAVAGSEDDDLEDLEIQRAKLKGMAEEIKLRAKKLEDRARSLR